MPDLASTVPRSGMARDIGDIPGVVERVVSERSPVAAAARAIRDARPSWATIVARGSSDHAAIYLQYLLEAYCGLPAGLALPSATTVYGARIAWRGGLVIAISQSGQSPDVVALIEEARGAGALTVAITNQPMAPLGAIAEHVLECRAGEERAIPATKTYVASLAVAATLIAELMPNADVGGALGMLPHTLQEAIDASRTWLAEAGGELLGELHDADRGLIISRGFNLSTAYETALKLKEACGLFATGYSSADALHGPLVVAVEGVPMLAFRADGAIGRSIDQAVAAAQSRGLQPWLVGGREVAGPRSLSLARDLPECLTPLPYAVMGEVLCERLADRIGRNPDAPVGLSKVTRTM